MRKYDTAFDQLRDAKMLTWRPWVLKPGKLLFVGSGVATNCKRKLLPGGVDAKINNHRKVGNLWLRTGALKPNGSQSIELIGIPNPGGAHGFSPDKWRDATRTALIVR